MGYNIDKYKKGELVELDKGFTRNQVNVGTEIVNAKHNLSATELKIFYQCATLIDPVNDKFLKEYHISVKDFCEAFNIEANNRPFLVKTLKKLVRRVFEIDDIQTGNYFGYPIFGKLEYHHKEQMIKIAFNGYMYGFLLKFRKGFMQLKTNKYINALESKYAIRFYTYLKDYRKMAHRDFDIATLAEKLELPKSYENYRNLYDKVISPAIQEINAKSDLNVSEPEIIAKNGKKVLKFRLYFENKSQKIANEIVAELLKKFKEQKSFNVFRNCFFAINENIILKIDKISTQKNTYFEALTREGGDFSAIFGTPNRDDFLRELCNGIFNALCYVYEKEKQEQLPTMQWQDQQDRQKRLKEILRAWQEPKQA